MNGGRNPKGAGRKPMAPELKKAPVSYRIPRWLVKWLRKQSKPTVQIIEAALVAHYKIKAPSADNVEKRLD